MSAPNTTGVDVEVLRQQLLAAIKESDLAGIFPKSFSHLEKLVQSAPISEANVKAIQGGIEILRDPVDFFMWIDDKIDKAVQELSAVHGQG